MKPTHSVSRTCLACHAKKLGEPVTARDCLGFAECETCTKIRDAWSKWLEDLHEREPLEQDKKVAPAL